MCKACRRRKAQSLFPGFVYLYVCGLPEGQFRDTSFSCLLDGNTSSPLRHLLLRASVILSRQVLIGKAPNTTCRFFFFFSSLLVGFRSSTRVNKRGKDVLGNFLVLQQRTPRSYTPLATRIISSHAFSSPQLLLLSGKVLRLSSPRVSVHIRQQTTSFD